MAHERGLKIHFTDGTSIGVDFPIQTENPHARAVAIEDLIERRLLVIEADGALVYIPFDNVKYIALYPAVEPLPKLTIKGATLKG